ncbi:hypothetical protein CPU03_11440 [Edwardsiella tarda]|nr:hypothetical protein CPU03_11440 [Edwardsiella tarda]
MAAVSNGKHGFFNGIFDGTLWFRIQFEKNHVSFSSLQKECIRKCVYPTRELARADIFDYIEAFYNQAHRHLGGITPEVFDRVCS